MNFNKSADFGSRDCLAALAVVVIWGLNFVAMKHSLNEFTPFQLGFFRYIFAVLPLLLFVPKPNLSWRWLVPAGIAQLGQFAFLFVALNVGMTAAVASVLMQTQVFFTTIFGFFLLNESVTRPMRFGLAMAAMGLLCFLMNFSGQGVAGSITFLGLLLNIGAAVMWSASNIIARKAQAASSNYDALQFVVWMSLIPIVPFGLMAWFFEEESLRWQWMSASGGAWLGVAYLGWFATIAAYALWTWLLKRHSANKVAPFSLGVPVIGLAAGMFFLNESVLAWQWAGSVFIVTALFIVIFGPRIGKVFFKSR